MSILTEGGESFEATWNRKREYLREVGRAIFGDRLGLCLFLGALLFFGLYWTSAVRINDNYTLVNALAAMLDGHFDIRTAVYQQRFYGPEDPFNTPGMKFQDGKIYGRNYGQLFLALPFALGFKTLFTVFDPRLIVVGLWCLGLLALAVTLGKEYGRESIGAVAGSIAATALFVANVALAEELAASEAALLGLQLSAMVAAALVGVITYRMLSRIYDRRIGLTVGVAVVLATPVAYWANIPKRHSLTALFAILSMYTLYRARTANSTRSAFRFRALSYVWVGLMTWVFPQEGPFLLAGVAVADLATTRRRDPKTLAVLGGVMLMAFVPFFVSNLLVTGNPLYPPQFLPSYGPAVDVAGGTTRDTTGLVGGLVGRLVNRLTHGVLYPITDPTSTFQTFVRSGYFEGVTNRSGGQAISLSMLESAPILGGLIAIPVVSGRVLRREGVRPWLSSPIAVVDVFVLTYSVALLIVYLPSLPGHAQGTVRYLHPLYVTGTYALVRIPAIRAVLRARPRTALSTFSGAVLIGGQLIFVALFVLETSLGEAIQAHALLNLATASGVLLWVLISTGLNTNSEKSLTIGAVSLGLAAAATTVFVLLSRFYHLTNGEFLLPLIPVF
jgi:hypothetical protein